MQEDAPRSSPANDIATAFARRAGRVRRSTRYVEEVKTSQPDDRAGAFLAWAEVALWPIDVDINSGDSGCAGVPATAPCFHYGTFPELTGVRRGVPLGHARPEPVSLLPAQRHRCLWVRRWSQAVVAVNETRAADPRRHLGGRDVPGRDATSGAEAGRRGMMRAPVPGDDPAAQRPRLPVGRSAVAHRSIY